MIPLAILIPIAIAFELH